VTFEEEDLFGELVPERAAKQAGNAPQAKKVIITVKAAPNPSERHGETVCVAGIEVDALGRTSWIRLYPINFRHLQSDDKFKKYDVVSVDCLPATQDSRTESWKPAMATMETLSHLRDWAKRAPWVEPLIEGDMCAIRDSAAQDIRSASLGLVRPKEILDFEVTPHPGWTSGELAKIDAYVNQLEIFDTAEKTPLEAPPYRGHFHWRCWNENCKKHVMGLIDWEFVALQRHLRGLPDAQVRERLRVRWLEEVCAPDRDVAFYVGNQAKRPQTFSILGVWWPKRTS
jgi:hypothetical protein